MTIVKSSAAIGFEDETKYHGSQSNFLIVVKFSNTILPADKNEVGVGSERKDVP